MNITYDKDADVLYITLQDVEAVVAEEVGDDVFIRYIDGPWLTKPVGITIMNLKRYIE